MRGKASFVECTYPDLETTQYIHLSKSYMALITCVLTYSFYVPTRKQMLLCANNFKIEMLPIFSRLTSLKVCRKGVINK